MAKTNEEEANVVNEVTSAASEATNTATPAPTFDPETIITSDRFSRYADMLGAVLENREYTVEEVEKLLDKTLSTPIVEVYND